MKVITLCGRPRSCCPKVYLDYDVVSIEDDDGHLVTMNTEQFKILKQKILNKEFDLIAK